MRIVIWLSVKLQSASILFFNSVEAIHLWHLNSTWLLSSGCPFKELHIEAVPIAFPNNFISCHCWGDEVGKEQKDLKIVSHVYFGNSEKLLLTELENSQKSILWLTYSLPPPHVSIQ